MSVKRVLAVALCFALVQSVLCADAFAIQPARPGPKGRNVRIARLLDRLGTGDDALIAVRLRDNSVVSGYLAQAGPDSLVVADLSTGRRAEVGYSEIARLQGFNVVTGAEAHYGGGIRAKMARAAALLLQRNRVPVYGLSKGKVLLIGIIVGVIVAIVLAKTL